MFTLGVKCKLIRISLSNVPQTYISYLKVLSHEEIKRCTGLGSNTTESRAAVVKESGTKVSTQLRVIFKQQFRELQIVVKNMSVSQCVRSHRWLFKTTEFIERTLKEGPDKLRISNQAFSKNQEMKINGTLRFIHT